jgi:hypothetical protein
MPTGDPPETVIAKIAPPIVGRAPSAVEQLAFNVGTRRNKNAAQETLVKVVDDMVQQVAAGAVDPQQAVESTGIAIAGIERELLRRLGRSAEREMLAIVQLLAVGGSHRSVPALLNLGRRDALREESLAAIEQIVGTAGLAQAVRLSNDPQSRRMLIARLLSADEEEASAAVGGYLSLVQDVATRGEALAVADTAPRLPLEALLTALQSEEKPIRLSAALVLGHVNGPVVTRQLVDIVTAERPAPTEAWIALLVCRGELAQEFLSYATRSPQLLGHVNNARAEWARMNL